jgi:hypothetical protein
MLNLRCHNGIRSDATLDNAHVAEGYLARTQCIGSSELVGLVIYFYTLNQLNKVRHVWQGVMTSLVHHPMSSKLVPVVGLVKLKPVLFPHCLAERQ